MELTTRFRDRSFEGGAALLAYDEISLLGSLISDDIRKVLDARPNTMRIYILAPFFDVEAVKAALDKGTAAERAGGNAPGSPGELYYIGLKVNPGHKSQLVAYRYEAGERAEVAQAQLEDELMQGWLFDLFDRHKGRVDAPPGVHFGKGSGKHATQFLRVANVLLSSTACAVLATFALTKLQVGYARRVFVDTASLLPVALAMQRIALLNGIWEAAPPAQSFSSYGGMDKLPSLGRGDVALISASTSGGMVDRLKEKHLSTDNSVTFYFLETVGSNASVDSGVLCNLTYRPERTFGYPRIQNYSPPECVLCKQGMLLAELEGDQFLLEKRGTKRLRISKPSQPQDARDVMELLARQKLLHVPMYRAHSPRVAIGVDVPKLLGNADVKQGFQRLLKRFTPHPINFIVLVDVSEAVVRNLLQEAGLNGNCAETQILAADAISQIPVTPAASVLVVIGYLADHALLRGINAQLRTMVPGGCVSYLAALTAAESARNLSDLRSFLSYGERGADTFTCRSVLDVMLTPPDGQQSSWDHELALLRRMKSSGAIDPYWEMRIEELEEASQDALFLKGLSGDLAISPDFVYLKTESKIELISQADIYAVILNLLACARNDNVGFRASIPRDTQGVKWTQTVYGQVLLCPSNFRDYNDAVLRAAFLRAATTQELTFMVDAECSREVLEVLHAELASWGQGKGDSLPEFLMALATRRMRLTSPDLETFMTSLVAASVAPHLNQLAARIPK
ncbi:MAG: hypothetical protein H0X13_10085 [Ramlibacter sp.]|nr:hypothetical protein [Ramlibacter sp.]